MARFCTGGRLAGIPQSRANTVLEIRPTRAGTFRSPARGGGKRGTVLSRLCGTPTKRPPEQNPALGVIFGGLAAGVEVCSRVLRSGSKIQPRPHELQSEPDEAGGSLGACSRKPQTITFSSALLPRALYEASRALYDAFKSGPYRVRGGNRKCRTPLSGKRGPHSESARDLLQKSGLISSWHVSDSKPPLGTPTPRICPILSSSLGSLAPKPPFAGSWPVSTQILPWGPPAKRPRFESRFLPRGRICVEAGLDPAKAGFGAGDPQLIDTARGVCVCVFY
jgi:hypothetical protein